ncbi:MAG: GGDEF domain-containing protein [Bacillota bacterium]
MALLPFPLKTKLHPEDITTELVMLLASLVLFFYLYKLCSAYSKERSWIISLFGVSIYSFGAALDLLDEFYKLPQIIPRLIENTLIATGISFFAAGTAIIIKRLITQAITDSLTGLYNKSHLEKVFPLEIERAKRYSYPLSMLFLDLDNFKNVNDHLGHTAGDKVLYNVSEKLRQTIRNSDLLFRYGGDEFILLMPQTDIKSAHNLFLRLQDAVAQVEIKGGHRIGISAGIVGFPQDGASFEELVHTADKRMYESKIL